MHTFSVGEAITFGWETFKKRPWFFAGAAGIFCVIEVILQAVGKVPFLGAVISMVAGTYLGMGVIRFSIRAHDSIMETSYNVLWNPKGFWRYLGAGLLKGLITAGPIFVGIVVLVVSGAMSGKPMKDFFLSPGFIIPGIVMVTLSIGWLVYASARLMFVEYLVLDADKKPFDAVRESFHATQWSVGRLVLFSLAIGLLNLLGALALLIGLLVTIPVSLIAMAHAYRTLCAPAPSVAQPTPVTPTV